MADKTTSKTISLSIEAGTFTGIFRRLRGNKESYNFSEISDLRKLLSNERVKALNVIKNKNPVSIYSLARILNRDFKSVRQDVKLLEKFGILELESNSRGKREMLKPVLAVNTINIAINL